MDASLPDHNGGERHHHLAGEVRVEVTRTSHLAARRLAQIRTMLLTAFDGEFTEQDWNHTLGGWHAVVSLDAQDQIVSHAAVVPRRIWTADRWFASGYVEGVATAESYRHRGFGSIAMVAINEIISDRFELGVLSSDAYQFYMNLGWERWCGTTSVDTTAGVMRTPDEDDGILVYRFGPSAHLALDGEIRCEARPGDDW